MARRGRGFSGPPPSGGKSWQALSRKQAMAAGPPDPAAAIYERALELHRAGRLAEAYEHYHRVLAITPAHPEANHSLGLLSHETGNHEVAARLIGRAIEAAPSRPGFHADLGRVQLAQGRPAEAVESYRRALKRNPDMPDVLCHLGIALLQLGRAEEAAQAQRRALVLRPDYPAALANRGRALAALGRGDEAVASLEQALRRRPDYLNAHVWLGDVLAGQGKLEDAASSYRTALSIDAHNADGHFGLAEVLFRAGRLEAAADNYRAAIYVRPSPAAFVALARTLIALGRPGEAVEAYRMAARLAPEDAQIAAGLAALGSPAAEEPAPEVASGRASDLEREEAQYRMAVSVTPDNPVALNNLASTLSSQGRLHEALDHYRRALALKPDYFLAWSELLFTENYLGDLPVAAMVADARTYGEAVRNHIAPIAAHSNLPDPRRRLRIGMVSADLRRHPVARFLEAFLSVLDPAELELFAYSTGKDSDELTERLQAVIPNWRAAAAWTDAELERAIVADGIDILIDLAGHSAHNRLLVFARKPAPVAVTWLGYFATTGLAAIDYVLCNRWVIPEAEEGQWVERPWRLPETYLCFTPPKVAVPLGPPPLLTSGVVTFGSANNLNKLSEATLDCWAAVLQAVPQSRLLLRSAPLGDDRVLARTRERFAARGIGAERLLLEGALSDYGAHLAAYNRVDIALDPFPYAGGTTSVEALWMGVPVLTRAGDRYVSHMGESILHNLGLPEWIAADTADYVAKAQAFAADAAGLAKLRQGLRHRLAASPLMDAPRFARNLEAAFRQMWVTWCDQQGVGAPPG